MRQTLDALCLRYMAEEAHSLTEGARLNKIQHLSPHDWLFSFWGARQSVRLYVNLSPEVAAAWLTEDPHPYLDKTFTQPTGLCLLLRKHLLGARVAETFTLPDERVWVWQFYALNELGQPVVWQLVLELMGKTSNMLLVQRPEGLITAVAHGVSEQMSRLRPLRPGIPYQPPPQPTVRPGLSQTDRDSLIALFSDPHRTDSAAERLQGEYAGCSRMLFTSTLPEGMPPGEAADRVLRLAQGDIQPAWQPARRLFSLGPHPALASGWQSVLTVMDAIRPVMEANLTEQRLLAAQQRLSRPLHQRLKKHRHQMEALTAQLHPTASMQLLADQLMAALSMDALPKVMPSGDQPLCWQDPLTHTELSYLLPLDPQDGPPHQPWMHAIQRLYGRAKKQKNQQTHLIARCKQLEQTCQQDETALYWITQATTLSALRELDASLETTSTAQASKKIQKARRQIEPEPAATPSGLLRLALGEAEFWIGRTQQANTTMLSRYSRPKDWWFHARQLPGSHVLVKAPELNNEVIEAAAGLAAWHSQGRHSGKVSVIYTACRFVRAVPDSYPGHVTYRQEQEVLISPNAQPDGVLSLT